MKNWLHEDSSIQPSGKSLMIYYAVISNHLDKDKAENYHCKYMEVC